MTTSPKLSLWSAILINTNVMFGTGIFINTIILAQQTGFLGFLSYALVAILITPLIVGFSELIKKYPTQGFYGYAAAELSPFIGFLSAWSYFIGKLASAALLIHVFSTLVRAVIPGLVILNPFLIDIFIIALFAWLNIRSFRTGHIVMNIFLVLKIVPVFFVIGACLYLFDLWAAPPETFIWSGIPSTIPLVLFAFTGFEICCSLSGILKNPTTDGPRVIVFSYAFVLCMTIIYQLIFFAAMGPTLMTQTNSLLNIFPPLLQALWPHNFLHSIYVAKILHIAIAIASLGGSYGIFFSNHWNLFILAKNNQFYCSQLFTKMNKFNIPILGVFVESLLCFFYLLLLRNQIPLLQQIAVLGCTISFTCSMIALTKNIFSQHKSPLTKKIIAVLSLLSCALFFIFCIRNFILYGISSLYLFAALFIMGILLFRRT